jgi:hypothetical protein
MTTAVILVLWCVLPALVGTMRAMVLRGPHSGAKLTLRTVSVHTPVTGVSRGRREG